MNPISIGHGGSSKVVTPIQLNIPEASSSKPPTDMNKVGQSIFYDCLELSPVGEKQDDMKPERSDTEEESRSKSFVIFFVFVNHFRFIVIYYSVRDRSRLYNIFGSNLFGCRQY